MQQKTITKVSPMMHGHLHLEFEDGSMKVIHRGDHETLSLKPGDLYPPAPAAAAIAAPSKEA